MIDQNSGHTYAQGAETCLRFEGHLCPVCRNLPQIQGTYMPGVQKPASDLRDIYALCAETSLRFEGHLCPVCRNQPQFQGTFMPGVHNLPPDFRLIFQTLKRDDWTFRLIFESPIWLFQKNRLPLWR